MVRLGVWAQMAHEIDDVRWLIKAHASSVEEAFEQRGPGTPVDVGDVILVSGQVVSFRICFIRGIPAGSCRPGRSDSRSSSRGRHIRGHAHEYHRAIRHAHLSA